MKTINLFNGDGSDPAVLLVCHIKSSGCLVVSNATWLVELRFPQRAVRIPVFAGPAGKCAHHAFRGYFPDAVIADVRQVEVIVLVEGALLRMVEPGIRANAVQVAMLAPSAGKVHWCVQHAGFPVVLGPQDVALV